MLEKAIFITKVSNLKYVDSRYSRLYFGNEFCERLIPNSKSLKRAIGFVYDRGIDFSFVTPYVTELGLQKIKDLLSILEATDKKYEVIINDWGVLDLLSEKHNNLKPVFGRLLVKQNRDPRIAILLNNKTEPAKIFKINNDYSLILPQKIPDALATFYKESNVNVSLIQDFLVKQRISRVELDNLFQGLSLTIPKGILSASLYIPYGYICTTRYCSASPLQERKSFHCRISSCKQECQRYTLRLKCLDIPVPIFKKGNTLFFRNSKIDIQRKLEKKGISRIVYQPEIPL